MARIAAVDVVPLAILCQRRMPQEPDSRYLGLYAFKLRSAFGSDSHGSFSLARIRDGRGITPPLTNASSRNAISPASARLSGESRMALEICAAHPFVRTRPPTR